MKTLIEKRQDAMMRIKEYTYDNSRAKRKGVSEDAWNLKRKEHLAYLGNLR